MRSQSVPAMVCVYVRMHSQSAPTVVCMCVCLCVCVQSVSTRCGVRVRVVLCEVFQEWLAAFLGAHYGPLSSKRPFYTFKPRPNRLGSVERPYTGESAGVRT